MLSIFLAKLIGIYLILVSLGMFINKKDISLLFGMYVKNPKAVYLTGLIDLFAGLAIVLSHNIWVWDYRVIITFVGWVLLFRGVGCILFPQNIAKFLKRLQKLHAIVTGMLFVTLFVGLYLAYMGFLHS